MTLDLNRPILKRQGRHPLWSLFYKAAVRLKKLLEWIIHLTSGENQRISGSLYFSLRNKHILRIRRLLFCLLRHKLTSVHHIWLGSKILMQNSSDRVHWKLELLSNGLNRHLSFVSIIFYTFPYKSGCYDGIRSLSKYLALGYCCGIPVSGVNPFVKLTASNNTTFRNGAFSKFICSAFKKTFTAFLFICWVRSIFFIIHLKRNGNQNTLEKRLNLLKEASSTFCQDIQGR